MQTLEALQIKRKPRHPCLESKAWCSSASRCTPPGGHRTRVELIYSRSKSRCCFYCSRMRIIHFMCPQGAGGPTRKSNPKCWMSWQPGSRPSCWTLL